ncbi:HAD superfamily hydrolase [Staphylococcus petrasii]|uniref:HAD family phosphatase n=1 Tax=Staphylococcus petrasii TaxID=1276936 RepID=A0A380G1U6_9STAP|nr:Cof-type HAD-IIB family hydrolase [Staphylococcus petrasii]PNZ24645.1 Cof-type HAD-IIB family hydrolase [Staphylococcus petrasii]PNZ80854.1 Cof-type HAD-IIB family hydrolase [Staphylococcus petrasii]TGA82663.1 HAD family phosphatase [Staphylococcus petrasii]TGE13136.1 HAD family phosphatase [Staphylococcus petrasii]TGE19580.1 HAD family phosphatase [Staphylococcus petrasii]
MSNFKVIVMDMDDTLINSDNKVSPETKEYLIDLQNQGYKVVLASGRPTEGMLPIAKELHLDKHDSYIISYNGGKTIKVATEKVEVSKSVSKEDFDEIADFCREKNFLVLTYQDGHIIHDGDHEYRDIESQLTGLPMKRVNDIKAYINEDVPKVMGVDYVENITNVRDALHGSFNSNIDVTTSKPFFLEFMAKGVSKGNAIKALCEKLDIPLKEVVCFGDSLNDQSMFEVAGYSVAMGNATEELKEVADKVTLDNDSNGIPAALKEIL